MFILEPLYVFPQFFHNPSSNSLGLLHNYMIVGTFKIWILHAYVANLYCLLDRLSRSIGLILLELCASSFSKPEWNIICEKFSAELFELGFKTNLSFLPGNLSEPGIIELFAFILDFF